MHFHDVAMVCMYLCDWSVATPLIQECAVSNLFSLWQYLGDNGSPILVAMVTCLCT